MFALLGVRLGQFYKKTFMKCTFVLLQQLIAYITDFLFWINWGKKSSNQNHNIITIQQKWHIKYRLHKDSRGVTSRIQLCRCCDNIGNVSTFYMLHTTLRRHEQKFCMKEWIMISKRWSSTGYIYLNPKIILTFQKSKHIRKKFKNRGW